VAQTTELGAAARERSPLGEDEVELRRPLRERVALEARLGYPERVDDVARRQREADRRVRGDDQPRGRSLASDDGANALARVREPPLPLEGGDVDPQSGVVDDAGHAVLGAERERDQDGRDQRQRKRVQRLDDRRVAPPARGLSLPPAVADEGEEDDCEHDGCRSDEHAVVEREQPAELFTRVGHAFGLGDRAGSAASAAVVSRVLERW
jgi:hypothetical protein